MKARQVAESIPAPFHPTPATPAQMVWLHQHMIDRGLYLDGLLPTPGASTVALALLLLDT